LANSIKNTKLIRNVTENEYTSCTQYLLNKFPLKTGTLTGHVATVLISNLQNID